VKCTIYFKGHPISLSTHPIGCNCSSGPDLTGRDLEKKIGGNTQTPEPPETITGEEKKEVTREKYATFVPGTRHLTFYPRKIDNLFCPSRGWVWQSES
ncbi:mCG1046406, partial [Mus musculus]